MKQENESQIATAERPAVSFTTVLASDMGGAAPPAAVQETPAGIAINFHSAEFNRTDGLDDSSGNYRSFETLDGIITADMRHRMEGRLRTIADAGAGGEARRAKTEIRKDEPGAAEAVQPVTVISHGRTLIIDENEERALACAKFLGERGLNCTLLVTKAEAAEGASPLRGRSGFLEANAVSITGAFGGFSASATRKGDQQQVKEHPRDEAAHFDLVLDLQAAPSYAGGLLPPGYYAPGPDPANLQEVLRELPEMRGLFKKPQFIAFLEHRCFHGRSRTRDCRRCLEICPVGAIRSADRKITVDHYLCQGCSACALVCPADAVQVNHPVPAELLDALRLRLKTRRGGTALPPTLIISDSESAAFDEPPDPGKKNHGRMDDRIVNFAVEQIGFVGMEIALAALAYGADRVVVACGAQNPPALSKEMEWQVEMARAVLQGLGMPADKVCLTVGLPETVADAEAGAGVSTAARGEFDRVPEAAQHPDRIPPATFSPGHDKRTLARLAVQHLYDRSGAQQPNLPLPAGSPFGAVTVDSSACTSCMACVVACPSLALSARGDAPRLEFIESRCHQCGLCEEACPEGALRLLPRMLCDHGAVEASAVLHEVEPFRCIECGAPFASRAMINRIQDKLAGHWMYAGERQVRRLLMCRTCRAQDALTSEDMKVWNQR